MQILLPEIVAIGIYNTQIAVKNRTVTPNRNVTMFEIELPMESGGISYLDAQQITITPDWIICAKPGQIRHTKLPYKCYYIHMIVRDRRLTDLLMGIPDFLRTNKHSQYLQLFNRLCKCCDNPSENSEILLQSLILELIYTLLQESKTQQLQSIRKSNHAEMIQNVIHYISENLDSDLSLQTVAGFAGFSPIHFHNCFKAATGKTLHAYVEEQRIKKAAGLLTETNCTLTQIAYRCGFSSQSYFSSAFKRKMQMTPREYAKMVFRQYEREQENMCPYRENLA